MFAPGRRTLYPVFILISSFLVLAALKGKNYYGDMDTIVISEVSGSNTKAYDENGNYAGVKDLDDPDWDTLLSEITLDEAIQFIEKGGDDKTNANTTPINNQAICPISVLLNL